MYPLGLLPWSLADAYGLLRKTNKGQLFKELEKNVAVSERHLTNVSNIYDGMANLQKLKLPAGVTFRLMAEEVFSAVTNNTLGGGGGVSESTDRRGCAILALEVVPKNLIFAQKSYPKICFARFHACYFSKETMRHN